MHNLVTPPSLQYNLRSPHSLRPVRNSHRHQNSSTHNPTSRLRHNLHNPRSSPFRMRTGKICNSILFTLLHNTTNPVPISKSSHLSLFIASLSLPHFQQRPKRFRPRLSSRLHFNIPRTHIRSFTPFISAPQSFPRPMPRPCACRPRTSSHRRRRYVCHARNGEYLEFIRHFQL